MKNKDAAQIYFEVKNFFWIRKNFAVKNFLGWFFCVKIFLGLKTVLDLKKFFWDEVLWVKNFSWGWKFFLGLKPFFGLKIFLDVKKIFEWNFFLSTNMIRMTQMRQILGWTCVLLNGSIDFLVFLCNLVNFQILRTLALENAKRLQIIYEVLLKGTESWVIISTFSQTGFLCRLCRFGLFSAQITRKWRT